MAVPYTLSVVLLAAALTPAGVHSAPESPSTGDRLHFEVHPVIEATRPGSSEATVSSPHALPIGDRLHVVHHPVAEAPSRRPAPALPAPFSVSETGRAPRPLELEAMPDRQPEATGLSSTFATYNSPNGVAGFGYSVSAVGDVDGDGYADFMAMTASAGPTGNEAYLYRGGPGGPDRPSWQYKLLPYAMRVAAAGDLNNDGYDDVAFGAAGRIEVRYGHSYGLNGPPDFIGTLNGFGFSIQTAGDVNGDGYADIVAGGPYVAPPQAVIYFGSAAGLSNGNSQFITGFTAGPTRFGYSVAGVGDMNGDGYSDVAFGAPDDGNGEVYIGMGSPTGITLPFTAGFGSGILNCFEWGLVVGPAGDLNGDGYADVMAADPTYADGFGGSPGYSSVIGGGPGGNFIVLGGGGGYSVTNDHIGGDLFTAGDLNGDGRAEALITAPNSGYVRIMGMNDQGYLSNIAPLNVVPSPGMTARVAGDLNGDGFSDIVVGIPEGGGQVRVYYGMAEKPGAALTHRPASQFQELSGWSVAMGDVNGDGFDDVVVGKPSYDGAAGVDCGGIDLYLGGPDGIAATPVWTAEGFAAGDGTGGSSAAGQDENGDGYGDILVGAGPGNKAILLYGRPDWQADPSLQGWYFPGAADTYLGSSVAFAGDVNGDGLADVLVGAPNYTDPAAPGTPHVGKVILMLGGPILPTVSSWSQVGTQAEMRQGSSVAGAGDVNADGYGDVIIGTPWFDGVAATDEGMILVYLGGPGGPSGSPALALWGIQGWMVGNSVAGIGDFNRDGFGDIAFGAPGANNLGRVYVVAGDYSNVNWWSWDGPGWGFGNSVAPAGDVDGDGSSDLLVGDVFFDGAGGQDVGRMQVYPGGALAGGPALASWEGAAPYDNLGHALAGGGDVNGDGYADVAGGEPRVSTGNWDGGAFAVAMGNAAHLTTTVPGVARPTHQGRAFLPGLPVGMYGVSNHDTRFGLASLTSSPGGRDRVAFEWRVGSLPGVPFSSSGRTPWTAMGPQSGPSHGAVQLGATPSGLVAGNVYSWTLRQLSRSPYFRYGAWLDPQPNARGQWDIRTRATPVAVGPGATPATSLELSAPWPSPARGETHVAFVLPRAGEVELAVRDVQGRRVRTLENGPLGAGRHERTWNGSDASGRRCAAGLYFLDLSAGDERASRRVVLAR